MVRNSLVLGGRVLKTNPDMLAPQLLGRLLPERSRTNIGVLLQQCESLAPANNALCKFLLFNILLRFIFYNLLNINNFECCLKNDLKNSLNCCKVPAYHCLHSPGGSLKICLEGSKFAVFDIR